MKKNIEFFEGLKSGIPIGLGYLSVSFTFGIIAISYGLFWWQAVLISMLTVTSAGQFAGIKIMCASGSFIEMLISQLTVNIRYSFMSISLSQKVDKGFNRFWRTIFSFMITDEVFAVASTRNPLKKSFFFGLTIAPYLGWTIGTLLGALLGNILPKNLMSALSVAIYAMFIAIVVPEAKKFNKIWLVIIIASILSILFTFLPILKEVPTGISISICAILAAGIAAFIFPIDNNATEGEN